MDVFIKTDRLLIVPVSAEHIDDMAEYACDVENAPYMIYLPYPSKKALAEYICLSAEKWDSESPDILELAVIYEGKVIGGISIYFSDDRSVGELGWIINKNYWRNGFAYEAAAAVMKWAAEKYGFSAITAECDDRNVGSYSLMEKLGFVLETRDSFRRYERTGEVARERKYIYRL